MEDRHTVLIELDVADDEKRLLGETVAQFEHCANETTEWCWADRVGAVATRTADVERRLFRRLRSETALPPNLVQQAIRRGVETVKSSVARSNDGEQVGQPRVASGLAVYDERDAALDGECMSLATVDGRVSCDCVAPADGQAAPWRRHAEEGYEFRGGQLECRGETWYLHASMRSAESGVSATGTEHGTALGVELGTENVAVASTGTFWSTKADWSTAAAFDGESDEYGSVDLSLHRVGNELVREAVEHGCSHVVFEDVTDSGETSTLGEVGGAARRRLRQYVEYRAAEHGVEVARVTSEDAARRCSTCGFEHEDNHDGAVFECLECGFENHAAYNASKNIGSQYRQQEQQQVAETATKT